MSKHERDRLIVAVEHAIPRSLLRGTFIQNSFNADWLCIFCVLPIAKGNVQKGRCLTPPTRMRQDAPFLRQDRPACAKPLRRRQGTPLADPAPSRGHAFSTFPYTMRASVSPYTGPEPARRSVLAHSFRVVPVVKTSSTNKIRLPLMRARLATEKALRRLVRRAFLDREVCGGVGRIRRRQAKNSGIPSS